MSETWTLHFDGANEPVNPRGIATYGFVLKRAGEPAKEGKGLAAEPGSEGSTNNVAEYVALLKGLEAVKDLLLEGDRLEVFGDSELVINQMKGRYAVRAPLLIPLSQKAQLLAHDLRMKGHPVELTWIPRGENSEADRLSKEAVAEALRDREILKKVKLTFGKHNGKTLAETPTSYISWLIENKR